MIKVCTFAFGLGDESTPAADRIMKTPINQ